MNAFRFPKKSLGELDAEAAAAVVVAASDLALVMDAAGVIGDIAFQGEELGAELDPAGDWVGRPWIDTVTSESRSKVEALLREAVPGAPSRWRHINHPNASGVDVPVLYASMRLGAQGRVLAFGRDLRIVSTLQRRLLDAQQSMDRDYTRMRQVETRYRLLFQTSAEAVLIVDALSQKILETNPAAERLFESLGSEQRGSLLGRSLPDLFAAEGMLAVQAQLAGLRVSARGDDVRARLAGGPEITVAASLFQQDSAAFYLVRLAGAPRDRQTPRPHDALLRAVEAVPDGFVVTDPSGRVILANRAFLQMAELGSEPQAAGEMLDRWLGQPGVDVDVLRATLRQRGTIRLFASVMRGELGAQTEVELSAVQVAEGGTQCLGFAIRDIGRRLGGAAPVARRDMPRSVEQLTELVGRVPLKELVRESTEIIERLCIEAALQLTGDNRAAAAEMLGLSRQSLYVKLRRFGLSGPDGAEDGE